MRQADVELEARWADYATAHARLHLADGTTLEVGPTVAKRIEGEFADPAGRTIHVITADNPGRDVSAEANAAAHERLLARATELHWEVVHAHGGDPSWTHVEACIAVFGAPVDEVLAIGREFGQDAVFEWTPSVWNLISCDGARRVESAWRSWQVRADEPGPRSARVQP